MSRHQNRCMFDSTIMEAHDEASSAPGNYMLQNDLSCQPHITTPGSSAMIMSFDNAGDRADVQSSLQQCSKVTRCGSCSDSCNIQVHPAEVHDVSITSEQTRTTNPVSNRAQVNRFIDMGVKPIYQLYVSPGVNTREQARQEHSQKIQSNGPLDQSMFDLPDSGPVQPYKPGCP